MPRNCFVSPSTSRGRFRLDPSFASRCVPLSSPSCSDTCSPSIKQTNDTEVTILCRCIIFNEPDSVAWYLVRLFLARLASKCFDIATFSCSTRILQFQFLVLLFASKLKSLFLYPLAITCRLKSDLEIWIIARKLRFAKNVSIVVPLLTKFQFSPNPGL